MIMKVYPRGNARVPCARELNGSERALFRACFFFLFLFPSLPPLSLSLSLALFFFFFISASSFSHPRGEARRNWDRVELREIVIADGERADILILYFGESHKRSADCAPVSRPDTFYFIPCE